ncbi:MAG: endonuclease/exonuclease/phosphatase family protein [Planctomycetaceae bacterium]|nr:endonuclease/exonuclease/phosphatase family protein [Planctomycetaceae bacterium]
MNHRLNRREALLAALGAAFARAARSSAQELLLLPPVAPEGNVRLLFFNTHLLPTIAQTVAGHRGQDDYRTAAIANQLDRFDLVGLCEVFESRRRQEIIRVLQSNSNNAFHAIEQPKPWGRHLIGSGLLLLSRYPIVGEPHFLTYQDASRVLTNGWKADGFAAKGVIHAQLRLSDQPPVQIDCFLTHLESVSSAARAKQLTELAGFIAANTSPDRPAILMGDLNVTADYPINAASTATEYGQLTSDMRYGQQRFVDLWPAFYAERGGTSDALVLEKARRIDYVFLSPPPTIGPVLAPTEIRIEPFLDEKVKQGSLSDHAGVACTFAVRSHQ